MKCVSPAAAHNAVAHVTAMYLEIVEGLERALLDSEARVKELELENRKLQEKISGAPAVKVA